MINITVEIEGLERLRQGMERAPKIMVDEASKAIQKSLLVIQNQAMKEAPANRQVGLGARLKASFRRKMTSRLSGEVFSISPYAGYVHEGTRPHTIEVINKKVLANKRTGQFFGKKVDHPGTRPNPFMQRAVDKCKTQINDFFLTAIDNVFNLIR